MRLLAGFMCFLAFVMTFILLLFSKNQEECVLVHGGGFAGFWYMISRLNQSRTLSTNLIKTYSSSTPMPVYCYSAGCLTLVASLGQKHLNDLLDYAEDAAVNYTEGRLNIHKVREEFVGLIVDNLHIELSDLNFEIITSQALGKCRLNRAKTKKQLKTYLLQTSDLPGLTSPLSYNFDNKDGIFCFNDIPRCTNSYMIPFQYNLIANLFNPMLTRSDVHNIMYTV